MSIMPLLSVRRVHATANLYKKKKQICLQRRELLIKDPDVFYRAMEAKINGCLTWGLGSGNVRMKEIYSQAVLMRA